MFSLSIERVRLDPNEFEPRATKVAGILFRLYQAEGDGVNGDGCGLFVDAQWIHVWQHLFLRPLARPGAFR